MKRLVIVCVLLAVLFVVPTAFGWIGQWNNLYSFGGHQGTPIPPGGLVQLIHAGDNWQQDDPMEWCSLQPDPRRALNEWLAAGCPPVGDDTLRDQTVFLDYGPGFEGYFGKTMSATDEEDGDPWYTRFFAAAQPGPGDYYGEVGDPDDPDDPIYELILEGWNGQHYDHGYYKIRLDGVRADKHIIPEPATLFIGAVALLLGFLRRRR